MGNRTAFNKTKKTYRLVDQYTNENTDEKQPRPLHELQSTDHDLGRAHK